MERAGIPTASSASLVAWGRSLETDRNLLDEVLREPLPPNNRPDLLPRCWREKPTGTTDCQATARQRGFVASGSSRQ